LRLLDAQGGPCSAASPASTTSDMKAWCAALLLALAPSAARGDLQRHGDHVTDGDTCGCARDGGEPVEIRLVDLDAPEGCQTFGPQPSRRCASRVLHQPVRVRTRGIDDYERRSRASSHRGRDVNAWLVREGYAWSMSFHGKPALTRGSRSRRAPSAGPVGAAGRDRAAQLPQAPRPLPVSAALPCAMSDASLAAPSPAAAAAADAGFMLSHPAHILALGFGSGLSPVAPGTCGTLWAWLAYLVMQLVAVAGQHRLRHRGVPAPGLVGLQGDGRTHGHRRPFATSSGTRSCASGSSCGW
jgi:endonuclease YncB( thermonuclease family)